MTDVFISYSREDKTQAKRLVQTLQICGFSVWWDQHILPGNKWREKVRKALNDAMCVVVLWSEVSTKSDNVLDEAQEGFDRGILVPVVIGSVRLPFGHGQIQTADLTGWEGDEESEHFQNILTSIKKIINKIPLIENTTLPIEQK